MREREQHLSTISPVVTRPINRQMIQRDWSALDRNSVSLLSATLERSADADLGPVLPIHISAFATTS